MPVSLPEGATPPAAALPLELDYTLDREDRVALYLHYWDLQRPRYLRARVAVKLMFWAFLIPLPIVGVLVVLPALALGSTLWKDPQMRLHFGVMVASCLAMVLVCWGVLFFLQGTTRAIRKRWRREAEKLVRRLVLADNLMLLERTRVVFTAEGLTEICEARDLEEGVEIFRHLESRAAWAAVARIDVTENHAFVIIARKGTLILPRRIFADHAAFLDHVGILIQAWRERRHAPTRAPLAPGESTHAIQTAPETSPAEERITR
jgi:hypothetical protein